MTVTLELNPDIERALFQKAISRGIDVDLYLKRLVERDLRRRPSLKEVLEPFRREVEESGISDDEFDQFVEEIREEIYQEQIAADRG